MQMRYLPALRKQALMSPLSRLGEVNCYPPAPGYPRPPPINLIGALHPRPSTGSHRSPNRRPVPTVRGICLSPPPEDIRSGVTDFDDLRRRRDTIPRYPGDGARRVR